MWIGTEIKKREFENMEISLTVLQQVGVMFVLIGVGAASYKLKLMDVPTSARLSSFLMFIVNPIVVINAYTMKFEPQLAKNLGIAFVLAIISHIIAIVIGYIFIHDKKGEKGSAAIERFSAIYTNCGFMALPLMNALFGAEGVFYASAYMTVFNLLSWTHGYVMISGKLDKRIIKKAFFSPVVISVFVGLFIFFLQIPMSTILGDSIKHMASLNTPLAMLVTGITLASSGFLKAFTTKRYYYVVLVGNVIFPLITAALYVFLPVQSDIVMVNLIAVACPSAVSTLLFANDLKKDVKQASNILALSSVVCVLTIPLTVLFYQFLLGIVK